MIETSCTVATSGLVAWSLFAGISAHEMEEFVWPGGFRAWYIRHSPSVERSMSKRFLIGINAVVLLAAAMAAWRFASPSMRFLWLAVGSAAAFNGLWHLQATLRTRRYSPRRGHGRARPGATRLLRLHALHALRLDLAAPCDQRGRLRSRVLDHRRGAKAAEAGAAGGGQGSSLGTAIARPHRAFSFTLARTARRDPARRAASRAA